MITQILKNKVKLIFGAILLFGISYILALNPIIPLFLLLISIYILVTYPNLKSQPYNFLNLTLLFVISFTLSYFILKQGWPLFYLPFGLIPMLSIILFDMPVISLLITLASSISIAAINGSISIGMLFLVSGIVSILVSRDSRRRAVIIKAGCIIGLMQMLALLSINHFKFQNTSNYLMFLANGIIYSIIVVGILPVFEYLFKTITNVSLLELADFNIPLMQRMTMEAPGTYHHSLIVGNLSDAACKAIGAHALLARIGAYYHDIGKLAKPDYFSENQGMDISKHSTLTPAMSKMVIMNHVKEGLDLAKKYKLNPRLIDFIQQHHGSSLVYYFYRRALETQENNQEVAEEGFRYPGPKPNTKETAVVLLADSVEAAARTLKEPSPAKIEELVHKIINNKFIDGQLDECDLTLKDLERIAEVFIRILTGIYHGRISYPETEQH